MIADIEIVACPAIILHDNRHMVILKKLSVLSKKKRHKQKRDTKRRKFPRRTAMEQIYSSGSAKGTNNKIKKIYLAVRYKSRIWVLFVTHNTMSTD